MSAMLPTAGSAARGHSTVAFDAIVSEVHRAGAGMVDWVEPLKKMEHLLDAWLVHFLGLDKRTGTVAFSYESGKAPPECALDYFRQYSRIDPRAAKLVHMGEREWLACHEYFDEAYVAASPFYQDFLIPYGGRYVYGAKIFEDANTMLIFSMIRGRHQTPFGSEERAIIQRLAGHVRDAFQTNAFLSERAARLNAGQEVLAQMKQPLILLDDLRRIQYCNRAGQAVLDRAELFRNTNGTLACLDSASDIEMMLAMREIALIPHNADHAALVAPKERRTIRVAKRGRPQYAIASMIALRPESTQGAFGFAPQVLLTVYQPEDIIDTTLDPFVVATLFDLTPAEANVAVAIAAGATLAEVSAKLGVAPSTTKSHLKAIFSKTGVTRQVDLVRTLGKLAEL
jgi:DNA-binding CsgD family transcriptional regulator